jgi:hypothetical protein
MIILQNKISLESLSNMLTTQSENFQKFEFEILAGIVSNTWWAKIQEIDSTVAIAVHVRPSPVAMLVESPSVEPSLPCPDPGRDTWRRRGRTRLDPPLFPSALCKSPTGVASPTPTHSAPSPRPSPASTPPRPPHPALPVHVARTPCAGHLLDALAPGLLAYKSPLRSRS